MSIHSEIKKIIEESKMAETTSTYYIIDKMKKPDIEMYEAEIGDLATTISNWIEKKLLDKIKYNSAFARILIELEKNYFKKEAREIFDNIAYQIVEELKEKRKFDV